MSTEPQNLSSLSPNVVIGDPTLPIRHLSSVLCPLSSVVCRLSSVVCLLSSVLGALHLSRGLYKSALYYAKRTQFPKKSSERNLFNNSGL